MSARLLGADDFAAPAELDRDARDHVDDVFRALAGLEESLAEPSDPAVRRVLPSASRDDHEIADEFRRLTEPDLRSLKVARLRTMWEQLSDEGAEWHVRLDEALATASALTDVRLVLAARLRLETDEDAERLHAEIDLASHAMDTDAHEDLGVDPERVWLGMLYQALTWLQESLLHCLMTGEEEQDV
ncbi:DUF2017 family protein [Demequina litorisediminis]|uniref:DUF2017 domain-containing protein n=1 Tax=Demequina litorisediminis TaxID=1849022 RepID=A0ABQ6IA89_9MICO|nr:DUF2017 family protein [Demequina litorisediminis]GMA34655.1 hypothetical protein GCM10025876_08590 [Demequina litorisediminis]